MLPSSASALRRTDCHCPPACCRRSRSREASHSALGSGLVPQRVNNLSRLAIDHIAGGRKYILRVNAQAHPPRAVGKLDIRDLLRRCCRRVKHVNIVIDAICQPDFFLVRRKRDPVALARIVARGLTGWESLHRNVVKLFAGFHISHFESENVVGIYECQRVASVHGKGTNTAGERPRSFQSPGWF